MAKRGSNARPIKKCALPYYSKEIMPYKDPQLSAQAKRVRNELTKYGATITHAQALELVAHMQGARTVHVAQARNNAPIDIRELAMHQAAGLAFESTGRYGRNVQGLIAAIRAAFDKSTLGSRCVEDAVHHIFGTEDSPKVSKMFDHLKLEDLPAHFDATVESLIESLEFKAKASEASKVSEDNTVFETKVYDWRVSDGSTLPELPPHHRNQFDLRVTRSANQLFVDMAPAGVPVDQLVESNVPQMTLFIEVNEGRPCVHLSNSIYGDQVLTVFFTTEGLYLRPQHTGNFIRTGTPSGPVMRELAEELNAPFLASPHISMNNAFIVNDVNS
jgi:hypothetical protein